jgi:methylase of polypeptide subunit release factors
MASQDPSYEPFVFRDPDTAGRIREVLARADFTDRGIAQTLGGETIRSASSQDVPLLLRRTSRPTPQDTLIRLFLIGVPVDADRAAKAVAPMQLEQWVRLGLLERRDSSVLAAVQLVPFQGLVLAHDRPQQIHAGLAPDYVMGIGSSSLTLANVTVRRPSARTLDLGTGCGLQALLAAPHSGQVLATDRNPRAVRLAAFNARLNGLENVECRAGDLFEPVGGLRFNLVVTNPPFVISPERRYIYRDSGLGGDEVVRAIVRQVPAYLVEGGFCQILCNWAHVAGQDWRERLAGWFAQSGCDAWVMRTDTLDAAAYAAKWIRHTERDDPEAFGRRFDQWVAYYERERIEAISGGVITLRRRTAAANWFRADEGPEKMLGPAGESVAGAFELHDFLESVRDDDALLHQRLRLSPDARLEQHFRPSEGAWAVAESELKLQRGLAYSGRVDPYFACVLAQFDGRRALGELAADLAAMIQEDPAKTTAACLELVRRLIERGFLLPGPSNSTQTSSSAPV